MQSFVFMIKKLPIPYIYCILIGIGLGIILGAKHYLAFLYWGETERFSWMRYFAPYFINNALWGFLVPLVYFFSQKYRLSKGTNLREKGMAVAASVILAAFHEAFSYIIWFVPMDWLGFMKFNLEEFRYVMGVFPSGFISRWVEYWVIYGLFSAFDYAKKYKNKQLELAQMEGQLANAQLSALRLQLHPHFLFNTLNTISSLMDISKKDAQKMVSQLGTLLRTALDKDKRQTVTLREELDFIKNYLDIEQVRFNDRLVVDYKVAENALEHSVPSLILQPLVENAIKHGFSKKADNGRIEIVADTMPDNRLRISVRDDGHGSSRVNGELFSSGIGLKNVRDRLELIYKKSASLEVQSMKGNGFEVILSIPLLKPTT